MEDKLRDIKPLLEIPDSSYYIYIGLMLLVSLFLLTIIVFLVKKFWKSRKVNMKKVYLKELKALDWAETKKSAYLATELGRKLATEERTEEIYQQFVSLLERYKYKQEVPSIDDETLQKYNLLVHVLDESI